MKPLKATQHQDMVLPQLAEAHTRASSFLPSSQRLSNITPSTASPAPQCFPLGRGDLANGLNKATYDPALFEIDLESGHDALLLSTRMDVDTFPQDIRSFENPFASEPCSGLGQFDPLIEGLGQVDHLDLQDQIILSYVKEVDRLHKKLGMLNKTARTVSDDNQNLMTTIKDLKVTSQALIAQYNQSKAAHQALMTANQNLEANIQCLSNTNNSLVVQNSQLREEISQLKTSDS